MICSLTSTRDPRCGWSARLQSGWLLTTAPAIILVVGALVLRKRAFFVGAFAAGFAISLPQLVGVVLPGQLTLWHVAAGLLWLAAFAILGCLYLMREAETRTDADIDALWLVRPRE